MKTIYITVGPPGSGKSTWYNENLDLLKLMHTEGITRISMDSIRGELCDGDESRQDKNAQVAFVAKKRFNEALAKGETVFWDATSARPKYRKELIDAGKALGYHLVCMHWNLPIETCLTRNAARARKVPEDIIRNMYNGIKTNPPCHAEGFNEVNVIRE